MGQGYVGKCEKQALMGKDQLGRICQLPQELIWDLVCLLDVAECKLLGK